MALAGTSRASEGRSQDNKLLINFPFSPEDLSVQLFVALPRRLGLILFPELKFRKWLR